jgi:hypothetical protein
MHATTFDQRPTVRPDLAEAFPAQFEACLALYDFTSAHHPIGWPTDDEAAGVLLWTYARSTKMYAAALRLAGAGYGEQASMLCRPLFEDMLIAHWAKRHPKDASQNLREHTEFQADRWNRTLRKLKRSEAKPLLSKRRRRELTAKFTGRTWTGLSMPGLAREVRDEWRYPLDKKIFTEMIEVVHEANNRILHNSAHGLRYAGDFDTAAREIKFQVGPSTTLVRGALTGAFWSYANTTSLVVDDPDDPEFDELYTHHMQQAFMDQPPAFDTEEN